jgi:hypothetical protein
MAEGSAITVKIGAETDGIEQGLKGIQNSLKNLESNTKSSAEGFGNSFTGMAGAVAVGELAVKAFTGVVNAGFAAARNVIQGFGEALDLGGRLSDLSASTGETAGKLLVLERAFDNSGIGAEKVGSSIAKMQKNIEDARDGSGTAASAFAMMGVRVEELEGKLPTEQFKILSSGIQSIDDPTQRAAAAMGVFGKSGAELLPLLTNLDGELGEARDTVGSMAEIMDRRSSVFDAVGDRFKTIGEKVRDFAAGILDKALPAIDAITSALSRIDAAKIGQDLANSFLGGEKAMSGFQSAVDAFQTGQISAAFQIFWDSTKLQAAQTANEIYKRLIAAFQTAGDFLGTIFSPSGALISTVISTFEMFGKKVASSIQRDLATTFEALPYGLGESVALALNDMANQSNTAANNIEDNLKGAGGRIAEQFTEAGKALPKSFEENYAKVPPLFNDLSALQKSIDEQEKAIKKTTEETNAERAKSTEQLEKEKEERAKIRAEAEAAAATERANAVALIEYETAINEAKAAGNEELVKSLESEKKKLENEKEIAKLTAEYLPLVGNNATEAGRLATNMVNAKNAAAAIGDRSAIVTITTTVDDTRWKDLLAELSANSNPKAIAVALEVTGKDNVKDAFATLQNMEQINKNFQASFETIGARSLEEVKANLEGIPTEAQKQLALQITGETDIDRAIGKLDSFAGTKTANALLETQGFEKMDELQNALNGVVGEKRTQMIVEALGVKDAEAAKDALDAILANNGKTATVTADADTKPAEQKIADLSTKTATVPLDGDTSPLQSSLSAFTATAQSITLDAAASISAIRTALAEPITMDLTGSNSGGSEGSSSGLTGLVSEIKGILTELNRKLPTAALAA